MKINKFRNLKFKFNKNKSLFYSQSSNINNIYQISKQINNERILLKERKNIEGEKVYKWEERNDIYYEIYLREITCEIQSAVWIFREKKIENERG